MPQLFVFFLGIFLGAGVPVVLVAWAALLAVSQNASSEVSSLQEGKPQPPAAELGGALGILHNLHDAALTISGSKIVPLNSADGSDCSGRCELPFTLHETSARQSGAARVAPTPRSRGVQSPLIHAAKTTGISKRLPSSDCRAARLPMEANGCWYSCWYQLV